MLLRVLILLAVLNGLLAARRSPCESRAPSSLSKEQRARLCEAAPEGSEEPQPLHE